MNLEIGRWKKKRNGKVGFRKLKHTVVCVHGWKNRMGQDRVSLSASGMYLIIRVIEYE